MIALGPSDPVTKAMPVAVIDVAANQFHIIGVVVCWQENGQTVWCGCDMANSYHRNGTYYPTCKTPLEAAEGLALACEGV